mmetsp:Transcript_6980/g.15065  ORF Transcript_6980/g.15065 Transcript_6980/m.15065 type:complete len:377 (+) Transcript_6980:257-1387(+)
MSINKLCFKTRRHNATEIDMLPIGPNCKSVVLKIAGRENTTDCDIMRLGRAMGQSSYYLRDLVISLEYDGSAAELYEVKRVFRLIGEGLANNRSVKNLTFKNFTDMDTEDLEMLKAMLENDPFLESIHVKGGGNFALLSFISTCLVRQDHSLHCLDISSVENDDWSIVSNLAVFHAYPGISPIKLVLGPIGIDDHSFEVLVALLKNEASGMQDLTLEARGNESIGNVLRCLARAIKINRKLLKLTIKMPLATPPSNWCHDFENAVYDTSSVVACYESNYTFQELILKDSRYNRQIAHRTFSENESNDKNQVAIDKVIAGLISGQVEFGTSDERVIEILAITFAMINKNAVLHASDRGRHLDVLFRVVSRNPNLFKK